MGRCSGFLHTVFVSLLETRVFMERRCSGGVYGVMKTRRGQSSSFMAMEPSVTLETRTSCRTWLGLGLRLGLGLGLGLGLR